MRKFGSDDQQPRLPRIGPKMVEDVKIIVRESPRNDDGEVRLFVDEIKRKLEEEGHTQVTGNHIEAALVELQSLRSITFRRGRIGWWYIDWISPEI